MTFFFRATSLFHLGLPTVHQIDTLPREGQAMGNLHMLSLQAMTLECSTTGMLTTDLTILNNHCYRAACFTATNGFSNKVYKGFSTYAEAHQVWRAFVDHNILPPDVLNSLSGPPPLPPTTPQPDIGGLAD